MMWERGIGDLSNTPDSFGEQHLQRDLFLE